MTPATPSSPAPNNSRVPGSGEGTPGLAKSCVPNEIVTFEIVEPDVAPGAANVNVPNPPINGLCGSFPQIEPSPPPQFAVPMIVSLGPCWPAGSTKPQPKTSR